MSSVQSLLLFGLLSIAALGSPAKRDVCQSGRQIINGQEYTVSCNIDRPGGDYQLAPTSLQGCVSACAADSGCSTAQYLETNGFCYFKNIVNTAIVQAGRATVDVGSACKQDSTLTFNGLQCTISCGVDYAGWDYSSLRTGNYLDCASACATDSNCATAQYNETNGFCYLKSQLGDRVVSNDTDTIMCQRAGSQHTTTSTTAAVATTTSSSTMFNEPASTTSTTTTTTAVPAPTVS